MNIGLLMNFIVSIIAWFLLFWLAEWLSGAEWLEVGKYYLTAIVLSFFIGVHVGITILKNKLTK